MEKQEYILCAAIWYKDIPLKLPIKNNCLPDNCDIGLVFCGHRHIQCMRSMIALTGFDSRKDVIGEYVQGFLTSKNKFVDRYKAGVIAFRAKQIQSRLKILYSEDLY